jgi:uncharacterized protein (DUF849 family)
MNSEVLITCAVTGAGDTVAKSNLVPVTPTEIAESAIEAARAGAAIVHVHVRDPETGAPANEPHLYRQVVELIRASDVDVVINLTTGMDGEIVLGGSDAPWPPAEARMKSAAERLAHVEACLPEMCTLDCSTLNFAGGDGFVVINTLSMLRTMAARIRELGVRPELEAFDTGDLVMIKQLLSEGLVDEPVLIQLCMGIPYGAPADPATLQAMIGQLPPNATYATFAIGRLQLPWVPVAAVHGAHCRVGLEDNLYLSRGELATNAQLVERAVTILEAMNIRVLGPEDARERLKLTRRTLPEPQAA